MEILNKLRNLDAYPKINEDFYSRSLSGGLITIVSSIVMLLLFLSEIRLYLFAATETKLIVDTSRGERLRINFDVTFPSLACSLLSVDTMDISGEQHYDIRHDIIKKRIDHLGNVIESRQDGVGAPKIEKPLQRHGGRLDHNETYCGSCYGAEVSDDDCCNSCEEVREAYQKKGWGLTNMDLIDQCKREGFIQRIKDEEGEGCNINGFLEVNKVAGNFHFAPGKSFHQSYISLQNLLGFQTENYNISHKINKLSFGKEFPGVVNPLDGAQWTHQSPFGMYQYFIKVVPTIYTDIRGHKIYSNQFSVTEHFRDADVFPKPPSGAYFFYDFSPIKVPGFEDKPATSLSNALKLNNNLVFKHNIKVRRQVRRRFNLEIQLEGLNDMVIFTEENRSLLHVLTNICAIIGGVFTVAGIIDAFVHHGRRVIKKKMELGKHR